MLKRVGLKQPSIMSICFGVCIGIVIGCAAVFLLNQKNFSTPDDTNNGQPLYWVAPMDANFRRDKPGKSPMGMDLVPVYEKPSSQNSKEKGIVTIAPHIINNLGVRTAIVESKNLEQNIHTVGYVKYDENQLIHIHPRVSGWVEKLHVKAAGDPVRLNQPLYSLYSPELVNAQEEFIIALKSNNTRLINASENRLKALKISERFINTLKKTKTVKQAVTFYSPQNGVIDNLNIREGFYVQPGTTLFSIGALDKVWVEVEIYERQASWVKKGDTITLALGYIPNKTWQGNIDYIYPTLDSQTRTIRLRIKLNNPQKLLLPNMFANVVIHTQSQTPLLLIPQEALIRTGDQNRVVLALGEGQFKSISVQIGRENQNAVEVIKGLNKGEKIVTSAQFLLDSESSKTSDFNRIDTLQEQNQEKEQEKKQEKNKLESVWVEGVIHQIDAENRQLTLSHEAIKPWNMMAMTMDFAIGKNINIKALSPHIKHQFHIQKNTTGMYKIIAVHTQKNTEKSNNTDLNTEKKHHSHPQLNKE